MIKRVTKVIAIAMLMVIGQYFLEANGDVPAAGISRRVQKMVWLKLYN